MLLLASCAAQTPNNSQQPADHVFLNGTVVQAPGFELKVFLPVGKGEFLRFLGAPVGTTTKSFFDLNIDLEDVEVAFPNANIENAVVWMDAKDVIMRGPDN